MAKKQPKPEEPAGESAPMWIVSFADLVTLMMSFFVVLYALKQGGSEQQAQTAAAIAVEFGYRPAEDSTDPVDLAAMGILGRPRPPMEKHMGRQEAPPNGIDGHNPDVQTIREGNAITTGGAITFDTGSAELDPEAADRIRKVADLLKGHSIVLIVKGHVSSDEVSLRPDDVNALGLSYRRATAVCEALIKLGIDRRVLRPTACGPFEPIKVQVYDEAARRANRRVEIYQIDKTINDYFPSTTVPPAGTPAATSPATATATTTPEPAPHSVAAPAAP